MNRPEEEVHSPIVGVEMYSKDDPKVKIRKHAVVLKESKVIGINNNFSFKNLLTTQKVVIDFLISWLYLNGIVLQINHN